MNRERGLTAAALAVFFVLVVMLSWTPINGRWLSLPWSRQSDASPATTVRLHHELSRLAVRQHSYHVELGVYAASVQELLFSPKGHLITVLVQAADSAGWTAVAMSQASPVACVLSGGTGPAANLNSDRIRLPDPYRAYEIVSACDEPTPSVAPQVISSTQHP